MIFKILFFILILIYPVYADTTFFDGEGAFILGNIDFSADSISPNSDSSQGSWGHSSIISGNIVSEDNSENETQSENRYSENYSIVIQNKPRALDNIQGIDITIIILASAAFILLLVIFLIIKKNFLLTSDNMLPFVIRQRTLSHRQS